MLWKETRQQMPTIVCLFLRIVSRKIAFVLVRDAGFAFFCLLSSNRYRSSLLIEVSVVFD